MKFGKLWQVFDFDCRLTEALSTVADKQAPKERRILNKHIDRLQKSNDRDFQDVDESLSELINAYSAVYLTAGFLLGKEFDLKNKEAIAELDRMEEILIETRAVEYLSRKKAPEQPGKDESGTPSEQ